MAVLVLEAAGDISFPDDAVVRRVKALVLHADTEMIAWCEHCPFWLASRLTAFLAG